MVYVTVVPPGVALLVVGSLLYVFAIVAVYLRVWSKYIIQRRYRLHDCFVFFALIFATGYVALSYLCIIMGGLGHHASELSTDTLTDLLKLSIAVETMWMLTTTCIKLSILFLYLDLFGTQHGFRVCTYGLISFVVIGFTLYIVGDFALCQPPTLPSDLSTQGHCGASIKSGTISATVDMVLNVVIIILAIPVAFKLKFGQDNRFKALGIFAVGTTICLISISHLVVLQILNQVDFSYDTLPSSFLACIEIHLSIIAVCLPTLNPILTRRQNQTLLSPGLPPPKPRWTFNRKESVASSHASHPAFDSDEEIYLRGLATTKNDDDSFPVTSYHGNEPKRVTGDVRAKKATSIVVDSLW